MKPEWYQEASPPIQLSSISFFISGRWYPTKTEIKRIICSRFRAVLLDFIFLGSKITADGGCSHEIKRCLLLGRKAMINLDSLLKSRDITSLAKVHLVKAMVFPVVMYGCESWTIKEAEHQRIDDFEPWCWRKLLRVPLIAKRSNQSILKEINSEYSLEGLCWSSITLAKSQLIGKAPDAGKDWGQEEKQGTEDEMVEWHHWLNGHEFQQTSGDGEGQGNLACCSPAESDTHEWLNNNKSKYEPLYPLSTIIAFCLKCNQRCLQRDLLKNIHNYIIYIGVKW